MVGFRRAWLLPVLLLLVGCSGPVGRQTLLEVGTQGTQVIMATRGIVSEGTLFVQLDRQVQVRCTVCWEVLGEDTVENDVALLLEGFRMALQDAMDSLSTEGAWAEDMDQFVAKAAQSIAEELSDTRISVAVEELLIERVEDP